LRQAGRSGKRAHAHHATGCRRAVPAGRSARPEPQVSDAAGWPQPL
jgi:hypothetical protein